MPARYICPDPRCPAARMIRSHPSRDRHLSRWIGEVGHRTQGDIGAGKRRATPDPSLLPLAGIGHVCDTPSVAKRSSVWPCCSRTVTTLSLRRKVRRGALHARSLLVLQLERARRRAGTLEGWRRGSQDKVVGAGWSFALVGGQGTIGNGRGPMRASARQHGDATDCSTH